LKKTFTILEWLPHYKSEWLRFGNFGNRTSGCSLVNVERKHIELMRRTGALDEFGVRESVVTAARRALALFQGVLGAGRLDLLRGFLRIRIARRRHTGPEAANFAKASRTQSFHFGVAYRRRAGRLRPGGGAVGW
jgi:hypothetical protein